MRSSAFIGRNGAGKSTLLKILSRITEPTSGQADIDGRCGSLLEVGTGFHSELTGRENIYLNGAVLGMRGHEVDGASSTRSCVRRGRAVYRHAGEALLERHVRAPGVRRGGAPRARDPHCRRGARGRRLRFQQKCLGKMRETASGGRTVLFVSHNMAIIQALCKPRDPARAGRRLRRCADRGDRYRLSAGGRVRLLHRARRPRRPVGLERGAADSSGSPRP